jgi:hypothetical protein
MRKSKFTGEQIGAILAKQERCMATAVLSSPRGLAISPCNQACYKYPYDTRMRVATSVIQLQKRRET